MDFLSIKEWDRDPGKYEYFYKVKKDPAYRDDGGEGQHRSSYIGVALVSAAAAVGGNLETGLDISPFEYYEDTSEAMRITKEVIRQLKKKVDILSDITLTLAIDDITEALNQITISTHLYKSAPKHMEMALQLMRDAEKKVMESFYDSLKDEEALVLERLEKTTISLQLAIFLKIIIPSFRLDQDSGPDIGVFHELDILDRNIIAKNLKSLLDNLLQIQTRLKSKGLLPANGSKRANAGKFQDMVEFVKKIVYPYFMWGGEINEESGSYMVKGNYPWELISNGTKLRILPKYLGFGRTASCEINIGTTGKSGDIYPFQTQKWGGRRGTTTLKLWRGDSAVFGTSIEGRLHEEQLCLYHQLNNDNMDVDVDILEQFIGNKYMINGERDEEKMIFLGLEDVTKTSILENIPQIKEEDRSQEEKVKPLTLVPKDFPTWSSDRVPIYTNVWTVVDPTAVAKPPLAITEYLSRKFPDPKSLKKKGDDDGDNDGILWPWKPIVINIWRGEKVLFGTVCGVLVFIQPFQNLNEEIILDVYSLKRHCDWMDLKNDEIKPEVNVNPEFLADGYETRCPIILGDLPKHKEDLLERKNEEERDGNYTYRSWEDPIFWKGFLFSGCGELVVEIWKEDGNILGIIPGTDNVVICQSMYHFSRPNEDNILTLKESLKPKPKPLGEILRVSSSPGDRGNYMDVCGLYAKKKSEQVYERLSNGSTSWGKQYYILYDEEKKWQIKTAEQRNVCRAADEHKLQNPSDYPVPPVTGWRVNEGGASKGDWRITTRYKPANQINVISLGKKQSRSAQEVLAQTFIAVSVYALPRDVGARLPVVLEIDEEDVSEIQKALDYNFWAGWMAGGGRRLEMKVWVENGFVIATYENSAQVVFHQRLQDEDREIFISFDRLRPLPLLLGKRRQKQFSTAAENAQEIVKFECNGNAGSANEYCQDFIGTYIKTDQIIQGCPVFLLEVSPVFKVYLFVGPNGCWRVGPDVTTDSGSVLKNPQKHKKIPPESGWLFYYRKRSHPEWFEDDSLKLIADKEVEVSDECEKEDNECDKKTKEDVKSAFDKADTEGTGNLTRDQLKTALGELIESGHSVSFISDREMLDDDVTMRMFIEVADRDYRDYDYHNDEPVNLNDLLIIMELGDEKLDYKEMFTKLVNAADKNWNGLITVEKLRFALVACGFSEDGFSEFMAMSDLVCDKRLMNEEVVDILTTEPKEEDSDENKDGKLNYTEFCDILRILMKIRMEN